MVFHGQWRTMSDDQVVGLLEEIRDIQKQNAANDTVALQNQQEAMAMPGGGCKGARRRLWARWYCLSSLGGTYLASLLSWLFNWTLRH
jgi:hypothetical protein